MNRNSKYLSGAALLLAVALSSTGAFASANIFTGGAGCRVKLGTGFGDLDFDSNGAIGVKAGSDKEAVCSVTRPGGNFASSTFFATFTNANGKRPDILLVSVDFNGNVLEVVSFNTTMGNGSFVSSVSMSAAGLPTFGYVTAWVSLPANHNGKVLGITSPAS